MKFPVFSKSETLCALCKGSKLLCGKDRCPILVKIYSQMKSKPLIDSRFIDGSSPPGVFVGRYGYPKVFVGPLIPPVRGDTSIYDTPELWLGKSIDDITNFRFQLVRGMHETNVKKFHGDKMVEKTIEIALADNPTFAEAEFNKKPYGKIVLHSEVQPFGPSAKLVKFDIGNYKYNQKIEKAYYDTDLKAANAVNLLYKNGILISKIQKAFSVGAFGIGKNRRFVPTRWSITAVDDTVSKNLIQYTKNNPIINEFRVYEYTHLDNRWLVLMLPREWCYELIEAWYPKTLWNPDGQDVSIYSSHEFYDGRKYYAEIGGCYYAARVATNELLNRERKQAGVVILREAHPGYIMPVGVWNVRESVRAALKTKPLRFVSLNDSLNYISKKLAIPIKTWISNSEVLKNTLNQKKITDFIKIKNYK